MRSVLVVVIAGALLACGNAPSIAVSDAARLFVATNGSDAAAGSLQRPLRTLQRAVDRARPGTTVYVRGGQYAGFQVTRSGRPGKPITIKAYSPHGRPVISQLGEGRNVIELRRVHDVILDGLTVTGAPDQWGAGVRIDASSAIRVMRMTLVRNRSYGIKVKDSRDVRVTRNRITRNETGVELSREGEGVVIAGNDIFRDDRLIISDPEPGNDRGANGTVFHKTTGRIRVTGNRIWGNRGRSHDYGHDGGAFEVYAASDLEISRNVVWDNENVMETGTDGSAPCAHNRFFRNVAYAGGRLPSGGLILRCASDMLVANNTLAGLDRFAFDVTADDPSLRRFGRRVADRQQRGQLTRPRLQHRFSPAGDGQDRPQPRIQPDGRLARVCLGPRQHARARRLLEVERVRAQRSGDGPALSRCRSPRLQAVLRLSRARPRAACSRRDRSSTRSWARSRPLGDGLA